MVLVRNAPSSEPFPMTDLNQRLERLGLSQYCDSLVSEGFDTWETILDITESDLTCLNFKLGHRRKLQRAIAESRGAPVDRALTDGRKSGAESSYRSGDESGPERSAAVQGNSAVTSTSGTKRKYRRHPKPDANAPDRPPSAYVIFSNQVREDLKGQELSFTEIAKVVGERWQVLPSEIREACEQQANTAKERYYAEMTEYKKTPAYSQYQEYLVEFKAKHGPSRAEGKRSKLDSESSTVLTPNSSSVDERQNASGNRLAFHSSAGISRSSENSSPSNGKLRAQQARRPSSSSPAVYPDVLHSPVRADPYSPQEGSPRSTSTMTRRQFRASSRGSESQNLEGPYPRHAPPQQSYASYRPVEAWATSESTQASYFTSLPSRDARVSPGSTGIPGVPALTRQESTISSTGSSVQALPTPLPMLSPIDVSKAGRILPTPVMITGPRMSPLDQRALPLPRSGTTASSHGTMHSHSGSGSNWTTLLRATELAREAEVEPQEGSP